jgi:hypothetical protein
VRGLGIASGNVKALRKAGINARTIASLVENPLPSRVGPEIWIVDESSLVATSKANELLKAARELGVERNSESSESYLSAISASTTRSRRGPIRQFLADRPSPTSTSSGASAILSCERRSKQRQNDPRRRSSGDSHSVGCTRAMSRVMWTEAPSKPQYPSWPPPVRSLKCECPFTIAIKKSGRAELSHARHFNAAAHDGA